MAAIYSIQNLKKEYPMDSFGKNKKLALDGVTVDIYSGETTAIVGQSGSGKSTLALLLANLEKPTEGSILYQGSDLSLFEKEKSRRREIQIIFQNPFDSLDPRWSILRSIQEPVRHHKIVDKKEETMYIKNIIHSCGLDDDILPKKPSQLSGGQLQRACIARALSLKPSVLIADEIVTALDVSVQSRIIDLLKQIHQSDPFTLIFISHDLAVVRKIADRILVMKDGRIVEDGTKDKIFKEPEAQCTKELLDSMVSFAAFTLSNRSE